MQADEREMTRAGGKRQIRTGADFFLQAFRRTTQRSPDRQTQLRGVLRYPGTVEPPERERNCLLLYHKRVPRPRAAADTHSNAYNCCALTPANLTAEEVDENTDRERMHRTAEQNKFLLVGSVGICNKRDCPGQRQFHRQGECRHQIEARNPEA